MVRFIEPAPSRQAQETMLSNQTIDLRTVVRHLLKDPSVLLGFRAQFRPQERGETVTARNINAAFLIALTGGRLSYPAKGYLASMSDSEDWGPVASIFQEAVRQIEEEMERADSEQSVAVPCLRLAVQAAALFSDGSETAKDDGEKLVCVGSARLGEILADPGGADMAGYLSEKEGWGLYYDILDVLEKRIADGDWFSGTMREKAQELVKGWRV